MTEALESIKHYQDQIDYCERILSRDDVAGWEREIHKKVIRRSEHEISCWQHVIRWEQERMEKKKAKDTKRRQIWRAYSRETLVAEGIVYDQGNIQVLWRADIGWTGQQYASTAHIRGLMKGIDRVEYPQK